MSGNQAKEDQTIAFVLMAMIGIMACAAIWFFFHNQLLGALRWLRVIELHAIGLFTDTIMITPSQSGQPASAASVRKTLGWLQGSQAQNLSWDQMAVISRTIVVQYLRWPAAAGLVILGAIALFKAPGTKYQKVYNLDDLVTLQAHDWKYTLPIVRFDPSRAEQRAPGNPVPSALPLFAEALSPEEWLSFHRIPVTNGKPDRDAMRRAFVNQLGPRWQGPAKLPLHLRALLAAFALKGARRREDADKLLAELSEAWDPKKGLRLTGKQKSYIRQVLADPKIGGVAMKAASDHGYVVPALIHLLLWCRLRGGVLAAAQFLWLRAVDRDVWYPLNNAGRRAFHTEAGGAMAHYLAELSLRRMLPMPKVDAALDAIESYMEENHPAIPPLENRKKAA